MEKRMLQAEMILYGDSLTDLANYLGVVRQTLARKMDGESDFTQTEMTMIKNRYNLSDEKFAQIFTKGVVKK